MLLKVSSFVLFLIAGVFLWGPLVPVVSHRKNDCLMTYMHPSYKRYAVNSSLSSRYRLFLYKEDVTVPKEPSVARESGIPVLFVHGNAGSFKQVRSVGAEGYRAFYGASEYDRSLMTNGMASSVLGELMGLGDFEGNQLNAFDFWAVDFREELSGLSGSLVEKQSGFVVDAIHTILHHYQHTFIPRVQRAQSVVLLAHSMGGVVALAAAVNPRLRPQAVASIVSLATPLTPVILADTAMARVYRTLAASFEENRLANVSLTFIGGGQRDWFVPSRLSRPPRWVLKGPNVIYVDSLSISKSHVDADHVCIVWCNQIVRAVIGGLYRGLDPRTRMLFTSNEARTKAMRRRLVNAEPDRLGFSSLPTTTTMPPTAMSSAADAEKEIKARVVAGASVDLNGSNDVSLVRNDVCIVYNWTFMRDPVSISLSRGAARLLVRLGSGKLADVSHMLIQTQAYHLDDPRAGSFISVDHLLVRGIARLTFGNMTQLLVCPNKTTFRLDHHRICIEDGASDCSQHFTVPDFASFVTVYYTSVAKQNEGAVVYAINDGETRMFHSVKSGDTISVRFESARWGVTRVWVLFPANTTSRSVSIKPDYLSIFHDLVRPRVPETLLLALIMSCVTIAFGISSITLLAMASAVITVLYGILFVSGIISALWPDMFVIVGAICVSVLIGVLARVFAAIRFLGSISRLTFFLLTVPVVLVSFFFASPSFSIPWLLLCAILVEQKSSYDRVVALVNFLLYVAISDAPANIALIHTALHSGWSSAASDVENARVLLGAALLLILLTPRDLFPSKKYPKVILATVGFLPVVADLKSVFLVPNVAFLAYLIVSQGREEQTTTKPKAD